MSLGNKISELRRKKGISQEKLAQNLNVSRQTISKWEQDSVLPDTANIIFLCRYF